MLFSSWGGITRRTKAKRPGHREATGALYQ